MAKSAVLSAANNKHRLANQRVKGVSDRDRVFGCQKPCIMSFIARNGGTDYCPKGKPRRVKVHDFEDEELGKVAPMASTT